MLDVTVEVPVTVRGQAVCDFCKQTEHIDQVIQVPLEEVKDSLMLARILPADWDRVYKKSWSTDGYGSSSV